MATFNFYLIDEDSAGVEVFEKERLTDRFTVSKAIIEHQEDPGKWATQIYSERVASAFLNAIEVAEKPDPKLPE